jgi:segregation and condensation protein B
MCPSPDPPFEPQQQGISLDELAEAFAQVMGVEPRRPTGVQTAQIGAPTTAEAASTTAAPEGNAPQPPADVGTAVEQEDTCPISPRTILEAMLFVGNRENRPLTPGHAAELMRDVDPDEIPKLVDELNERYEARGVPYQVASDGDGYRMTLRRELHGLRNRFYGRIRETRLSQAAIDVLALVAYQQPITAEKIGRLRGKPSNHVLAHLVRRGLLRVERPDTKKRTPHYRTTERFLKLFNLEALDDLPRSQDPSPP